MTVDYDGMLAFARDELGLSERSAQAFATGRAGSEHAAREQWQAGSGPSGDTVPSGLWPDVERAAAREAAVFGLTLPTARARVRQLVAEKLPDGPEAVRATLRAHAARLGGGR